MRLFGHMGSSSRAARGSGHGSGEWGRGPSEGTFVTGGRAREPPRSPGRRSYCRRVATEATVNGGSLRGHREIKDERFCRSQRNRDATTGGRAGGTSVAIALCVTCSSRFVLWLGLVMLVTLGTGHDAGAVGGLLSRAEQPRRGTRGSLRGGGLIGSDHPMGIDLGQRSGAPMAWLLPIRAGALVDEVDNAWLDALSAASAPRVVVGST